MKKQLETASLEKSITVDTQLQEIEGVISERNSEMQSLPSSDFMKIFWEQQVCHSFHKYMYSLVIWICNSQVAALKVKGKTGMRWHPLFVRWCLNLSRVSPKAYEVMKESGVQLPTRCTLNDYTHWVSANPGFHHEVDDFLRTETKVDELEDWQRCIIACDKYMITYQIRILIHD